jgi:ParB-like chromosome segregation protein Spo0J
MNVHPVAQLFPPMIEAQYNALKEDIRENGQREPITLWRGQVIDGVHRARACEELSRKPLVREWTGEERSLTAYVVSLNLHRRHLNDSQRAMVAEKIAASGTSRNKEDRSKSGTMSLDAAAKLLNVGKSTIGEARIVRRDGIPELAAAVERGEMAVYPAAKISKLPDAEQRAAMTAPPKVHRNQHTNRNPVKAAAERIHRTVESIVNLTELLTEALPQMNGDKRRSEWATRLRDVRTDLTRFITECER